MALRWRTEGFNFLADAKGREDLGQERAQCPASESCPIYCCPGPKASVRWFSLVISTSIVKTQQNHELQLVALQLNLDSLSGGADGSCDLNRGTFVPLGSFRDALIREKDAFCYPRLLEQ